jgi:hypothetical protein
MHVNFKKFFIITLLLNILISSIYFFFFSGKIYHYKFVMDRVQGKQLLEAYKNFSQIKNLIIESKNANQTSEVINLQKLQSISDSLMARIIRFTKTNQNYKYEYQVVKNLDHKEFKKLSKIISNVHLEGAYFLNPELINKVSINLYVEKLYEKEIFLKYLNFVIDQEINKFLATEYSFNDVTTVESFKFREFKSKINYFLEYLIYYSNISSDINKDIKDFYKKLDCITYEGRNFCNLTINDEKIILNFAERLNSLLSNKEFINSKDAHFIKLYDDFILSSNFFSKKQLNSKNELLLYSFLTSNNIDRVKLNKVFFDNIKLVERNINYLEYLSFLIYSLIFSIVITIIFKSFNPRSPD